jgi:hypothetical protein
MIPDLVQHGVAEAVEAVARLDQRPRPVGDRHQLRFRRVLEALKHRGMVAPGTVALGGVDGHVGAPG